MVSIVNNMKWILLTAILFLITDSLFWAAANSALAWDKAFLLGSTLQ